MEYVLVDKKSEEVLDLIGIQDSKDLFCNINHTTGRTLTVFDPDIAIASLEAFHSTFPKVRFLAILSK